jgi:hypothetical protein
MFNILPPSFAIPLVIRLISQPHTQEIESSLFSQAMLDSIKARKLLFDKLQELHLKRYTARMKTDAV